MFNPGSAEPLNLERGTLNFLEDFESCLQDRAEKIVDVRLAWIELDHGNAPLNAEVDGIHSWNSLKHVPQ